MKKEKSSLKGIAVLWTAQVLLMVLSSGMSYGDDVIKTLFTEKNWSQLGSLFLDGSHATLKDYFSSSLSVDIMTSEENQMTYRAKFADMGEIGVITFEKKDGKYLDLRIKNQIRPLYFIEKFKKYRVSNIQIKIGDAQIHLINGILYETLPFKSLLLFEGNWDFTVTPTDREEQLTLKRKYKREYFSQSSKTGVLVLTDREFLKTLPSEGETMVLENEIQTLFSMYRESYGIPVSSLDEYWYLPFPDATNLVISKYDKLSYYVFSYNTDLVPDTQLSESSTNNIILSYNSQEGFKMSFGTVDSVDHVNLNLFLNPQTQFISGTNTITYKNSTTLRSFQMAQEITLSANLNLDAKGINIFQKRDMYYVMGSESDKLSLFFKGNIKPSMENFEVFNFQQNNSPSWKPRDINQKDDVFYFLSRTDNYYPNPGNDFFKLDLSVALPSRFNCLASGDLVKKKVLEDTTLFSFSSVGTKGVSLVVGDFVLGKKLKTTIPLNIYHMASQQIPKNLDLGEIKKATDFFLHTFGPLDIPALHILLRTGYQEGGISNNGFMIVNLPQEKTRVSPTTTIISLAESAQGSGKVLYSPVIIRNRSEDHILHEMAHQWWGGVISWKSYNDLWLTEGLAHFSVMYYLKKNLDEKKYLRLLRKLKRWVLKHDEVGPIIYGSRINMLENSYEAYQSIIYNKSSLVLLMVMDMIGEQEFNQRLQALIKKYQYQSLSSMQFIREFCGKDEQLSNFLKKWIYSRALPLVELKLLPEDKDNDTKSFKKVVISVEQLNTDEPFIFPLQLKILSGKGTSFKTVLMTELKQRFVISAGQTIRSIVIGENATPLRERKQLNPAQQK